jgi:hypothetical protein
LVTHSRIHDRDRLGKKFLDRFLIAARRVRNDTGRLSQSVVTVRTTLRRTFIFSLPDECARLYETATPKTVGTLVIFRDLVADIASAAAQGRGHRADEVSTP